MTFLGEKVWNLSFQFVLLKERLEAFFVRDAGTRFDADAVGCVLVWFANARATREPAVDFLTVSMEDFKKDSILNERTLEVSVSVQVHVFLLDYYMGTLTRTGTRIEQ